MEVILGLKSTVHFLNICFWARDKSFNVQSNEREGVHGSEPDLGDDTSGADTRMRKLHSKRKVGFVRAQEIHDINCYRRGIQLCSAYLDQ